MLVDGCAGSWDGRRLSHCSAVPQGVSEGDALLSLWVGAKRVACDAHARQAEMRDALRARERSEWVRGLAWRAGDVVWVKWTADGEQMGGSVWRRATGVVEPVLPLGGGLTLSWPDETGREITLDAKTVRERVVHAGVVGPRPDEAGLLLVGRRVRVYWPFRAGGGGRGPRGENRVFAGLVVACDGESGMHLVRYDDGDELWEELGGPLAPRFCLEDWE
jgi:hypothetical protein